MVGQRSFKVWVVKRIAGHCCRHESIKRNEGSGAGWIVAYVMLVPGSDTNTKIISFDQAPAQLLD